MNIWPNFFIVGAPRAGTTSLYEYLKKIPGVYMSPEKEPHFFAKVLPDQFRIGDKKSYLKLFEEVKNEKIIGEASTTYLRTRETPTLIHNKIPHAKIIISLREPIEQFVSSYFFNLHQRATKKSLHEVILARTVDKSGNPINQINGYSFQVKRYLNIFGENQVKIIIFEEFIADPKKTLTKILKFLDIKDNLENFEATKYNVRSIQNNYELNPNDKELLINYFQDDVKKLQSILKIQLPWKDFNLN